MQNNYCLLFKTGDAELRCLGNTSDASLRKIFPIIEITRGRKLKGVEKYPIENRLNKIYDIFSDQPLCLDITSHHSLLSDEIKELFNPANGYKKWIEFIREVKTKGRYSNIIPCIQSNFNDEDFVKNYTSQITSLIYEHNRIAYRSSLKEDGYYDDIEIIAPLLTTQEQLVFIIDCEYLPSGSWHAFAEKAIARINNVYAMLKEKVIFIICSTSFPNNVGEIGNDDKDTFRIIEMDLFEEIKKKIGDKVNIIYGDYGSISPKRNDDIVMAHGWIPRIDVPTENEIYYVRERRTLARDYARTYSYVANKVIADSRFPTKFACWGIDQIKVSASGGAPGSSPSFWISVRMNIHLTQQIIRLSR